MIDHHSIFLLVSALVSIVGLILLIAVFKLNPFITLFLTALSLAVVTGMPVDAIVHSFEAGLGVALGHIAIVVAFGTMLGKMMAESGGADQIAYTLIRLFGEKNVSTYLGANFITGSSHKNRESFVDCDSSVKEISLRHQRSLGLPRQ